MRHSTPLAKDVAVDPHAICAQKAVGRMGDTTRMSLSRAAASKQQAAANSQGRPRSEWACGVAHESRQRPLRCVDGGPETANRTCVAAETERGDRFEIKACSSRADVHARGRRALTSRSPFSRSCHLPSLEHRPRTLVFALLASLCATDTRSRVILINPSHPLKPAPTTAC